MVMWCGVNEGPRRRVIILKKRPDPKQEYEARIQERQGTLRVLKRRDDRLVAARLAVSVWLIGTLWVAGSSAAVTSWWAVVPLISFLTLVVMHSRTIRCMRRTERSIRFYEDGLARIGDRWAGRGSTGDEYEDGEHPYSTGMNLFGVGSLFQLLNRARTEAGERVLASWLLHPAPAGVIRERQAAVEELRDQLDLREAIDLLGDDVRMRLNRQSVQAWGEAPPVLLSRTGRTAASLLPLATILAATAWIVGIAGPAPAAVAACSQGMLAWVYRRRVRSVISAFDYPANNLMLLCALLNTLEQTSVTTPFLVRLREELFCRGRPATGHLRRLALYKDLLDSRRNQLLAPFALLLLWATHLAFAIESWRRDNGREISKWVEAIGIFEAIGSLAAYSYEHPADPFPQVVEGPATLDGRAMGHPLLPEVRCTRNSIRLGEPLRLLIISGSNMSGKSTFLRVLGVNLVLAQAGAPVRADSLRLSPMALGSTLGIQDSLQAGASRFYAELSRIRLTSNLACNGTPVFFLFDELLHGTNSHDRAIGAEGVVRSLLSRGAIGVATTHDLALTSLAEKLAPCAANYHFEDRLENGRMVFDYTLRPGIVTHSNALELMRSIGLDV
ncbi:MAG: DNA mismatch repair protein MutS [Acidobacteria bacterium]|nr:DNA mismatch repair protein MutS [Acidobacteriota bacterium]